MSENQKGFAAFLAKKDIVFSAKRYGIDALGAMAQGLFASLLIGTILKTLGQQLGVAILVDIGTFAQAVTGPAMAVSIGYALKCPPLVLFSLIAVGGAANQLGGAGGPLAVFVVTIFAAEFGKLVSKETKVDIIVTPSVTICVGVLLSMWWAPSIGAAASAVGKPTCRNVHEISLSREMIMGEGILTIKVVGNAFLHSMVRTIVGTLVMVGRGQRKPEWVREVLEARNRTAAGENAPAAGLVFWRVQY